MRCFVHVAEDDKTLLRLTIRTSYDRYDLLCNILQDYCGDCQEENEANFIEEREEKWGREGFSPSLLVSCRPQPHAGMYGSNLQMLFPAGSLIRAALGLRGVTLGLRAPDPAKGT